MKSLMKRLSRVADSSQYNLLRRSQSATPRRKRSGGVPQGHLPVYVGEEMERFVVCAELLNHPIFVELLDKSAQEYGYHQKGVLRIPCHVFLFERVMEALSVGGDAEELLTSLSDQFSDKVETGLLPVLDGFCARGDDLDLLDVFQRFSFDNICKLVLDDDPCSLRAELPHVACDKAFNHAVEPLLHRHVIPESILKLQKWLRIGNERVLSDANRAFDEFIYPRFGRFQNNGHGGNGDDFKVLKAFERALNLMLAGRDTTSTCLTWLFWLVATNPSKEAKILEEIETKLDLKEGSNNNNERRFFNVEECRKLIYLHGALCESLRLFPPVALEHKSPVQPDYLPSGVPLKRHTKIIVSFYSVGRMESVWGKDWLEFKPERWISPGGGIKHEPSYKFPAFNVGPRTCLGKDMAFIQMKMVVLYRYKIRLVEGHPVSPRDSIILQARDGLKVRLSKRIV